MWSFKEQVGIEEVIATFVRTIPRSVEQAKEECRTTHTHSFKENAFFPDNLIANIAGAIYLFILSGELPYDQDGNIEKMARAFQAMWTLIHHVGGDEEGAREWFQDLNFRLSSSTLPPDRIAIVRTAVRERLFHSSELECPLDIMPYSIWNVVTAVRKFELT